MNRLSPDFLVELIKCCFVSEKILEVVKQHMKYQYLDNEYQKKLIKYIFEKHDLEGSLPTFGVLSQVFQKDPDVIEFLSKIKRANISEAKDSIVQQFEIFIKHSKFILLHNKAADLFNKGKHDELFNMLYDESKEIHEFSLKESYYSRVFADFQSRQSSRKLNVKDNRLLDKCQWGIVELDQYTNGGINKGTLAGILARSGVGKSTAMKWVGLSNARLGARVVHFQAEGSEQECLDLYDSAWTGVNTQDIEFGNIPSSKVDDIIKAQQSILETGGEIYVYASEKFDSMSLNDCREILLDIEMLKGPIDLIIWDYMELFNVNGNFSGESGERRRRREIGNKMTNICVEFKAAGLTAIQANDIKPEKWQDEDYCLTRSDISEFKGAIQPMAQFITLNQTPDEYDEMIMRLYLDKFRKHRSGQSIRFFQSLSNGRFYDSQKTKDIFFNDEK